MELASILRKRKHRITTGVEAIITLIRNGVDFGQIDRECSSFVKNPLNYMTGKHRKLSPSSIRNNTNYLESAGSTRKESPRGSEARNHNSSSGPQFSTFVFPKQCNVVTNENDCSLLNWCLWTAVSNEAASCTYNSNYNSGYTEDTQGVHSLRNGKEQHLIYQRI